MPLPFACLRPALLAIVLISPNAPVRACCVRASEPGRWEEEAHGVLARSLFFDFKSLVSRTRSGRAVLQILSYRSWLVRPVHVCTRVSTRKTACRSGVVISGSLAGGRVAGDISDPVTTGKYRRRFV
ncbi:hypothetical protein EI94DRAFT_930232 [Lactarius quietus]|nr:hypothetical protein EI94DRAFT_930232 [Lactarius quietus]